jgi:hypothetical protein
MKSYGNVDSFVKISAMELNILRLPASKPISSAGCDRFLRQVTVEKLMGFIRRYWDISAHSSLQRKPNLFTPSSISLKKKRKLYTHIAQFATSEAKLRYESTYLFTPQCRILFEKLIVTQLVKKILLYYGSRRFITVFTKARHWTLS